MNANRIAAVGVWGVIWALFVWGLGSSVPAHGFKLNEVVAKGDLAGMASALDNYAADHDGRFPAGLASLLGQLPASESYLLGYHEPPRDPWRRFYIYQAAADLRSFRVGTFGSDGAPGGRGDAQDMFVDSAAERR